MISAAVRPRGPFSLRLSARLAGDATRTHADGPLTAALAAGGLGQAWQQADGTVQLRAPEGAKNHEYYDTFDVEWARRWPDEEIWKARKTG